MILDELLRSVHFLPSCSYVYYVAGTKVSQSQISSTLGVGRFDDTQAISMCPYLILISQASYGMSTPMA